MNQLDLDDISIEMLSEKNYKKVFDEHPILEVAKFHGDNNDYSDELTKKGNDSTVITNNIKNMNAILRTFIHANKAYSLVKPFINLFYKKTIENYKVQDKTMADDIINRISIGIKILDNQINHSGSDVRRELYQFELQNINEKFETLKELFKTNMKRGGRRKYRKTKSNKRSKKYHKTNKQ